MVQRGRTGRIRSITGIALIAVASLLVVAGCGSDGSDEATVEETTTTKPDDGKVTEDAATNAMLDQFAESLEGSGFDQETIDCIVGVQSTAIVEEIEGEALDAEYQESCDVTTNEVVAGIYYGALLELGVPEKDAACARDIYAQFSLEEGQAFVADEAAKNELLTNCGIDPAIVAS